MDFCIAVSWNLQECGWHKHKGRIAILGREADQHSVPTNNSCNNCSHCRPCQAIDLVTVAQAFHRFDHPTSYQQVKWLLKGPNGVLAVWFYNTTPNQSLHQCFLRACICKIRSFLGPSSHRSLEFPFEPVEGTEHTGPFEFGCILGIHPVLVCISDSPAKGFELLRLRWLRISSVLGERRMKGITLKWRNFPFF